MKGADTGTSLSVSLISTPMADSCGRAALSQMRRGGVRASRQREVDPRAVEVHAREAHAHAVAQPEALARALAHQLVLGRVEVKVVAAELGHVHQPLDVDVVERYEYPEGSDAACAAVEGLSDAVLHVVALEPGGNVARRLVGAPLGGGAVRAQLAPVSRLVAAAVERRLDGTMHEQIGIAADRRREVR